MSTEAEAPRRLKRPADREIKLDDFEQVVNGVTYYPHDGESIWLVPGDQVEDALELLKLARYKTEIEALQGDPDEVLQAGDLMNRLIDDVAGYLAPRIVKWTVTDRRGEPLPQPDGDVEKVKAAGKGLLAWLFGVLQVIEKPADRKNG